MEEKLQAVLDEILSSVGDNGRYQKILYWFFLVPINIIIPWTVLVPIFQSSVPDHWCHVPGKPEDISLELWKNLTIPRNNDSGNSFSKCEQFETVLSEQDDHFTSGLKNVSCQNGWDFDTTWYDRTLPMDQNWVCDRGSFSARWIAVGVAGNVFGTLLFNTLSDYWGRKITTVIATQAYALFAICRLYVTSDWSIMALMFLSSMPFPANLQISYIWVLEQVSKDLRSPITSLAWVTWTVGMCILPLLAWLCRDWVLLGIITSVPFVLFIIICWPLPESPAWLISRGRVGEGLDVFTKIAKINKKPIPNNLYQTLKSVTGDSDTQDKAVCSCSYVDIMDFLKHPVLRKLLFILVTVYTSNYLMYYIIIYSITNISGNEFLNFFFTGITELPSDVIGWFCCEVFGRRFTGVAFFLMSTIVSVVAIFLTSHQSWAMVFVVVLCKCLVTVSFFAIYIQMAEVYPTSQRGTGIGICTVTALAIGITAPYIAYSGTHWPPLPFVILALIGLIGTVSAVFIPETLGASLPQTVSEVGSLWDEQPFWSYRGWRPTRRKAQIKINDGGVSNKAFENSSL